MRKPRGIMTCLTAKPGDQQKTAHPVGGRQRDKKTTVFRGEGIDPGERQMRHPGIDDDRIRQRVRAKGKTVSRSHHRLWPSQRQILSRPDGEVGVDLDRGDLSGATDDLRKNGAVVTCAGADMNDVRPGLEVELIIQMGPQARLAVVEPADWVNRDQDVMVEVVRPGILRWSNIPPGSLD